MAKALSSACREVMWPLITPEDIKESAKEVWWLPCPLGEEEGRGSRREERKATRGEEDSGVEMKVRAEGSEAVGGAGESEGAGRKGDGLLAS